MKKLMELKINVLKISSKLMYIKINGAQSPVPYHGGASMSNA